MENIFRNHCFNGKYFPICESFKLIMEKNLPIHLQEIIFGSSDSTISKQISKLEKDGKTIADDFRIRAIVPTICWLQERKAKIVLMSHLGRPEGEGEQQLSLKPIAERLAELLKAELFKNEQEKGSHSTEREPFS